MYSIGYSTQSGGIGCPVTLRFQKTDVHTTGMDTRSSRGPNTQSFTNVQPFILIFRVWGSLKLILQRCSDKPWRQPKEKLTSMSQELIELEAWERFSRLQVSEDPVNPNEPGCMSPDDWKRCKDLVPIWKHVYAMYLKQAKYYFMIQPTLKDNPFDEYMEYMCTYY